MRILLLTFTAAAAFAQTPSIVDAHNNYGRIGRSGNIAQGAIFVVKGSGLSDKTTGLQDVSAGGLKTTLEGVRIRIMVGTTIAYAPLYYVLPGQVAGVMPSTVPVGTGTVRVENNGRNSGELMVRVVKRQLGVLAYDAAPNLDRAIAQDTNYNLLAPNNATHPGEVIILYGSGLGPVRPGTDENVLQTGPNASGNMTDIQFKVHIGGKPVQVEYGGRSIYPGLDQLNIRVPPLDADDLGCDVPVVITTDGVRADSVTIPVTQSGSLCAPYQSQGVTNTNTQPTMTEIGNWITNEWFRRSTFGIARTFSRTWTNTGYDGPYIPAIQSSDSGEVSLSFYGNTTDGYDEYDDWLLYQYTPRAPIPQPGACVIPSPNSSNKNFFIPNARDMDAGVSLLFTSPAGSYVVPKTGAFYETYRRPPPEWFVNGRYIFKTFGTEEVDPFTAFLDPGPDFIVTNAEELQILIERSKGATVRWTGGAGSLVTIFGRSIFRSGVPTFTCWENASAGQFTIPASVLLQLPASIMDGDRMQVRSGLTVTAVVGNRVPPPQSLDILTGTFTWKWDFSPEYR